MKILTLGICLVLGTGITGSVWAQSPVDKTKRLQVSGVYPHLALFNEGGSTACSGDGAEGGIGAVTPWAGQLWMVTYSPHCPTGSSDKLYSISKDLDITIHPESVGGTPANRLIHRESAQLITGSYFIDSTGKVRVVPLSVMPGRMTATARHLADPANMVYFYDMEGKVYEVNVHTLAAKKLFEKPVPGWHGKGAYTGQHRFIVANNGEEAVFKINKADLEAGDLPQNSEEKGILASWDGKKWSVIERKQFTDVTGPGGIYGAPNDAAPVWSIGWDKRSVILKLLDGGEWYTYRLPKAAHTYDGIGGWYTEWPRIREVGNNNMLMDMHGMFYNFPKTFSRANSAGIAPVSNHLRYVPDFCYWNGQLVLATDETTILQNPMAGRSQSNLWFGSWEELKSWGPANGWGGPWINDTVKAGQASDAFLLNGFDKKILHLSHDVNEAVTFTLETDKAGNNQWQPYKTITVPAKGYQYFIFPAGFSSAWIRIKADKSCIASAFFHFSGTPHPAQDAMFNTLADIDEKGNTPGSLIRPAGHNKNLQVLAGGKQYSEVNEKLEFIPAATDSVAKLEALLALKKNYEIDAASVIVKDHTGTFRLPTTSAHYEEFMSRGARELESERYVLNAQGTLYEIGRESGFAAIRPITTHKKKIIDFCTWRGLLVISGTKTTAKPDGHYFSNATNSNGLWFGAIDDLWKLGKPRGEGGVWKNAAIKAGEFSLPYLMTGYDKKKVTLTADKAVTITLEVNTDLNGWHTYKKIKVPAGKTITHVFPDGYSAHWIRAVADNDCKATVWFIYQ
ncbi:hypothetical protein [Chitinophaga arvensicola]|uniref:BNR repeat-containing family member n=1 Tax=Chitinophaga arvensicola TaxID=29529 RepID=A0A1I0SA19_9BACT|nr:hypothetical protein [Chitinophaga arvensicola]SEW53130.1 hypothetical protein SAMN04488122_5348 [Chitinophaga arvensicola]